jgi:hypothetical protein
VPVEQPDDQAADEDYESPSVICASTPLPGSRTPARRSHGTALLGCSVARKCPRVILYNPFDRLTGGLALVQKDWHYVTLDELQKLLAACNCTGWKVLLGLCHLAGLRPGEALALRWRDVDFAKNRLAAWAQKTKRSRVVPIAPESVPLLEEAQDDNADAQASVVQGVTAVNVWRDFGAIRKRAGLAKYIKWCHTLRKNRESDWMPAGFPFHVVVEWVGHSDEVARQHHLRVNESDLATAAQTQIDPNLTQLLTQLDVSDGSADDEPEPQVLKLDDFRKKAGDGIRTHDVQLGKRELPFSDWLAKPLLQAA